MTTTGNNIETEYLELNLKSGWALLFQQIRTESAKFENNCSEAVKPQNRILNRYRDVNPFNHSRVILQRGSTDYINANLVTVEKANRKYILTQGPLPNTISHFWLMVWEQNSKAVLMLNKLVEKKQEKCSQYWPKKVGSEYKLIFDDVGLSLEYMEHQDHSYYLKRVLKLEDLDTGDSREVLQFHYTTWPDFGVPNSPTAFLEFLQKVRADGALEDNVGPAVVHCSAGIGRSGTFCLVDSCLVLIEKFGLNSVNVKEVLLDMRRYRMGLIQTPEQLKFSYEAIIEGAKQLSQVNKITKEDTNTEVSVTNDNDLYELSSEEDEPPPLPPPRHDSLNRTYDDFPVDRPLPTIPNSTSLTDFTFEENNVAKTQSPPCRPLPVVPADEEVSSEADELEEEEDDEGDDTNSLVEDNLDDNVTESLSPEAELRHRQRTERKENLASKVREMKRRQQANEQWTRLKRSLYKPFVIVSVVSVITGGLLAFLYYKS